MIISSQRRAERRHNATPKDQRNQFQRDRDRILYCSAFRRLAGITQIARAGQADVFHTRLAHTLKVAQVGRRLAEFVIERQPSECEALGVDQEVVEAACLAHDLGHPPFGHLGEETLNELVTAAHEEDGFEGNAQSFRILTSSAVRFEDCDGLDLTRATLAACIKYPWYRDYLDRDKQNIKARKWGVYKTERDDFEFAREGSRAETKTAEAELMDWADDIAYSVHDLEDFHRCGLIPWRAIFSTDGCEKLIASALLANLKLGRGKLKAAHGRIASLAFGTFGDLLDNPYEGTREQRQAIRLLTSTLIGRYVTTVQLYVPSNAGEACIKIPSEIEAEIAVLKQIAREYIIKNPALAAQQRGQRKILRELFEDLIDPEAEKYVPRRFSYLMQPNSASPARRVADCISTLTENEAVALHGRLRGTASGSVLDPIAR